MVILLVTGQLASKLVEEQARKCNKPVKVVVLNFPVASLMKPAYILREVKPHITPDVECIMVPGLVRGDVSIIEKNLGIKVVKGPKHAYDIPLIINNFNIGDLSKEIPADELIKERLKKFVENEISKIEHDSEIANKEGNYEIRGLKYGIDFPVRIVAEIVDAPELSLNELKMKALYYADSGANIIDIGMVASENNADKVKKIIEALGEVTNLPLSIDSMEAEEINEAIKAGIDMVISLDLSLLDKVMVKEHVHYVVVPIDLSTSYFPKFHEERVELLEKIIFNARKKGYKNLIADVILDPPFSKSFIDSLVAYRILRQRNPNLPILIGTGNITELIDADTPGMNALLTMMAYELRASFILSTEVSDKCRGVIKELSIASKMGFVSRLKNTYPKGIGYDLLILRDKKLKDEIPEEESAQVIYAEGNEGYYVQDPKGWFKIYIDRNKQEILVHYKASYRDAKTTLIIKGKNPSAIYRKISELGLISKIDHAAYLGAELQKAYIALKLGKSYVQDSDLF